MNRNALAAALVAGLVVLAGCSSGFTGSPDGTATGESALNGETAAEEIEAETGTLNMYISDEQNAIDEFEHLNVTITRVGVKPAGDDSADNDADDGDDRDTDADDTDANDTTEDDDSNETADDGNETADDTNTTESGEVETETPEAEDGADDEDDSDEADDEDDSDEADDEDDSDEADDEDDSEDDDGKWVEYEVDNRPVDLTQLKGANATKLSSLDVPNGSYEKVFVYVSDVNGTLNDGTDQRVKLPSGKLQLNSAFTVGDGEEVDFVFDITAVKAGNSGKYILKPVISESGTDVEIDDVDERDDDEDHERADEKERGDERDTDLNASFDSNVTAGEGVTLSVTSDGDPLEDATVFVGGERAGTTGANGTYAIRVPDDAEELEVGIIHEGSETELEVELGDESDSDGTDDESDGPPEETATTNRSQQRLAVG
ncbi:DUF4382 domain-containing protein [Halobellus salinus]|nr:DUF4382 domain-containing protein [Halobellus salinus]SMP10079.1 protein of unknown function [Halobellus salinus]